MSAEHGKSIDGKIRKNENAAFDPAEIERMLPEKLDELYETFPLTEDTTCGLWILRGKLWQKFANKRVYVILYGFIGCIISASYAYFNGTITTLEKRYKIPSRNTGIISIGNDISPLLASAVLSYYAAKGHRPRWMAFGLLTCVTFCVLTIVPHFLYGPGDDALALTVEYGGQNVNMSTADAINFENRKKLCTETANRTMHCIEGDGNVAPQVILFLAQFVSGIGQPLYYTLGLSYMDDNIQKSESPAFISLSHFMRMLGPAIGYTLASIFLKMYISPSLTPTIDNLDPRWLGAWWLGWIVLACLILVFAIFLAMFPKTLPRAAVRKIIQNEKTRRENPELLQAGQTKASLKDMFRTFRRLSGNVTYMLNNMSSLFYVFGYLPYWTFTPKYIETQYRQSASVSNLVTGTTAFVFSAFGILMAGFVVSKYRPSARYMAAWNVIVGLLTFFGFVMYIFLGCAANERAVTFNYQQVSETGLTTTCNANCSCDFVKYSPVCGENGFTYISGCHAGCKQLYSANGTQIYTDCSCIAAGEVSDFTYVQSKLDALNVHLEAERSGVAIAGSCPVDCQREFFLFLSVMCLLKLFGSSGRATNFLVSVRCVDEHDKSVAMGFGITIMSLFALIPSPIFFGWIIDRSCIVWGKTCSGSGNCWLYDGETMRYSLNTIASIFILIGVVFDVGVWYFVKDLQIFDHTDGQMELSLRSFKRKKSKTSLNGTTAATGK